MKMNLRQLIEKTRTVRRFDESHTVTSETLVSLVDLARLSASGANRQPLKYIIVTEPGQRELVYPCLAWAGYLANWEGPAAGERPSAYIIILGDKEISDSFGVDNAIPPQTTRLVAPEPVLPGAFIPPVRKGRRRAAWKIPATEKILVSKHHLRCPPTRKVCTSWSPAAFKKKQRKTTINITNM